MKLLTQEKIIAHIIPYFAGYNANYSFLVQKLKSAPAQNILGNDLIDFLIEYNLNLSYRYYWDKMFYSVNSAFSSLLKSLNLDL